MNSTTFSFLFRALCFFVRNSGQLTGALTEVTQMWIKFGKTFAMIFPIYILGYFEFSFSWVLIGLAMLFYWRKNHGSKDYRINRALAFLEHEEKVVKQSVPTAELPPWVSSGVVLILALSLSRHYSFFTSFPCSPCHHQVQAVNTDCFDCQIG